VSLMSGHSCVIQFPTLWSWSLREVRNGTKWSLSESTIHALPPSLPSCELTILFRWESKTPPSTIKCIHRIENIELWRGYTSKRAGVERLRGDSNEQWYWHGTRQISPEVIAKEGFDFRVSNSGMYGRGAYFAHSINYSSGGYQHTIGQANRVPAHSLQSLASPQPPAANAQPYVTIPPLVPGPSASPFPIRNPAHRARQVHGAAGAPGAPEIPAFRLMNLPPGAGPGDSQLILARVCVGRTAVLPSNNVRDSPSLSSPSLYRRVWHDLQMDTTL
jgi:hypothetical protein